MPQARIIAHLEGRRPIVVDEIAIGFVVARVAYFGFYLADNGALRSIAWMAGIVLAGALYFV
ncbi:MAG: MAPEG family protein [Polyangiales bacterium]